MSQDRPTNMLDAAEGLGGERSLASRATRSISFLEEQHFFLSKPDGTQHAPTKECNCGLARACRVMTELLEAVRKAEEELDEMGTDEG